MASRNKIGFVVTFALFVGLAFFAWKSGRRVYEVGPEIDVFQEGAAVVLSWPHPVEAPMAARFAEAFGRWKGRTDHFIIRLNSPGGAVVEGRLVIDEIEKIKLTHAVDTYVGAGGYCLSMCVPIYLTGDERSAAADATFMFHEPSSHDLITDEKIRRPGFEQRMSSEKFFERYFDRSQMNPEWRERLRVNWKGRDLWFTAAVLVEQESGVVQRVE